MRYKMKKSLICIFFFLSAYISYAQWQSDVRLTNDDAYSWTSSNNAWCVAANGSVVHIVWFDLRDGGNSEIYYKRSTDSGENWGADTRLTNNADMSRFPSIAVSGSLVHLVWEDTRDGYTQIYYKRSTDGGINWGADTRLTNINAMSVETCVTVSNSDVHVVWVDDRDGNYEIYYKCSTDSGENWGTDTRLTNNIAYSRLPSVTVSGSQVHVVWVDQRDRDGYDEVYYKRSTDGGKNWGPDTRLTNNTYYFSSWSPSISVSGLLVHVVWMDNRDGDNEIYFKRSTDGGVNWGAETRLTNNTGSSEYPSVAVSGSIIHVVWNDNRDGDFEIYYNRSTYGGVSWEAETRLTNASELSVNPSITVSGSFVHVVWKDLRDGNWEIYYKRDLTGNVSGIKDIDLEIPEGFALEQNHPNPFNPSTRISWQLPVSNWQTLKVYDVLESEVATLVDEYKSAGSYEVEFNAAILPSGVYFYQLTNHNFIQTRKMILTK